MLRTGIWLVMAGLAAPALAGVATDGTVGPRVRLSGDFEIGADLGRIEGRNLFQSFERFSLAAGERATFSGPERIRRIISRVTGGERSDIDGTLRSTIPGAEFYFLNPAGVLFGPNASLDLQGSFHVSTADELRFADGTTFSATNPTASSFTVAAPEAFGFLGAEPGALTVDGSTLEVPTGEGLFLAGGDVEIRAAVLGAPAGRIVAVSGAGAGATPVGDGAVAIRGGELVIEQSFVQANNHGEGEPGGISLTAGEVRIERSIIGSSAFAGGDAGPVTITAGRLDLRDRSFITSSALQGSTGDGGDITLAAGAVSIAGSSAIITDTAGAGRSGDMSLTADEAVLVTGAFSRLSVGTFEGSTGDGGQLRIATPRLDVTDGGVIQSGGFGARDAGDITIEVGRLTVGAGGTIRTSAGAAGAAGALTITASDRVTVTGFNVLLGGRSSSTLAASTFASGAGGRIVITAPTLEVSDEAVVSSGTGGGGRGGAIDLRVDRLIVAGNASVSASSLGSGAAGDVTVAAAQSVSISDSGSIDAFTFGPGDGGRVTIRTPRLDLSGEGLIATSSVGSSADAGDGGPARLIVDRLTMTGGSAVSSATVGPGDSGAILIVARQGVTITGSGSALTAGTGPLSSGRGGTVRIATPSLALADGATISARSRGAGAAGNVVVTAPDRLALDGASITTAAQQAGGGRISLLVGGVVDLHDSDVITSVAGGADPTAGNILIDPQILIIDNSRIQANAPAGFGGNVTIVADNVLVPGGDFEALLARGAISATGGDPSRNGTVVVDAPEVDLSGGLVVLEGGFVDSAELRARCGARRDVGASSFTGVGRGGLPPSPDAPLASGALGAAAAVGSGAGIGGLADRPRGQAFGPGAGLPAVVVNAAAGCGRRAG